MILKPNSTSFGRHETFGLRFGWLPKGYQALKENPKAFFSDDATVKLGVGKIWCQRSDIGCKPRRC